MAVSYAYYFDRLSGANRLTDLVYEPQPGFYRHATTNDAVAYFPDPAATFDSGLPLPDAPLICVRGHEKQSDRQAESLWPYCCGQPVDEATWRRVVDGGDWDDEAPGMGHNRPPAEDMSPLSRADKIAKAAGHWLDDVPKVENKTTANQAAHYETEIKRTLGDLADAEKEAVQPVLRIAATIREPFQIAGRTLSHLHDQVRDRVMPYLRKLDEDQREERERAKAAAEAARAAGHRAPAPIPTTRIGGRGHAVTLRSYFSAKIVSYIDALEAAATEPEVIQAVQKVADRTARTSKGKAPLPGTEVIEERR